VAMFEMVMALTLLVPGLMGVSFLVGRHGNLIRAIEQSPVPTVFWVSWTLQGLLWVVRALFGWPGVVAAVAVLMAAALFILVRHRHELLRRVDAAKRDRQS